ncbi:nucleotide sugar dehydrogenase [Macrococcoides bohemicum]|uniref:nucleotide sugar dehydrogenase n=1 Tax=Macrococcoides bohemicum TaxID=1903056 RepID=UPI00105A84C6|nr:nucleotide sugar dehydrogenase [Macrococcus bohemicus]TDL33468.1 nucleotide sugar dehydrogenase [Macrococcus bohemicus]
MKISIFGLGYVGLANLITLSNNNKIIGYDVDNNKIDMLKNNILPIDDGIGFNYNNFKSNNVDFKLIKSNLIDLSNPDIIIISAPTDYIEKENKFDTSIIESIIEQNIFQNKHTIFVIKSTINIGLTDELNKKYNTNRIIFSPEFLREGNAIYDSIHPSRIIIGGDSLISKKIADLYLEATASSDVSCLITTPKEAESIKLFSNTYLAMRVAFFNEIDSFCIENKVSAKNIISGMCLDPRIGNHYNNPSFGYGGYCLPKDTKQTTIHLNEVHSALISSINQSNQERKKFIVENLMKLSPKVIGIYRLTMKKDSSNFRESAIWDIIKYLNSNKVNILIYEPLLTNINSSDVELCKDLDELFEKSDFVLSNRYDKNLEKFKNKIFTRDVFYRD